MVSKKPKNPIDAILDKSLAELKSNSKAVEEAIEKLLVQEGIEVSESEYNEIQKITNTMNELDSVLLSVSNTPQVVKPKPKKRKKAKRRRK